MRAASILHTAYFVLLTLLAASVSCCTHSESKTSSIPVGESRAAFAFDWKNATSLTLAKEDPASGDHWMARVDRQQEKPGRFYDSDPWIIQTYSESSTLPDRLANQSYINHLLDTLSTFHATAEVDKDGASDSVRASYGLNPPRYAIRWEVWEPQEQRTQAFEAEIGNPVDTKHPGSTESYGVFPPSRKIYKVDGAAIAMLDYLKTFSTLRQEVLSPLSSDDVDEIEIYRGKRKILYAQRDSDRWANEKHVPWKKDVGGFLERITHLRIRSFLDAKHGLERNLLARIVLKDRFGNATEFRFARISGRELATVSTRGNAVFELYPTALNQLQP